MLFQSTTDLGKACREILQIFEKDFATKNLFVSSRKNPVDFAKETNKALGKMLLCDCLKKCVFRTFVVQSPKIFSVIDFLHKEFEQGSKIVRM